MTCPGCGAENRDAADRCLSCGHALSLPVGTVLADRYEIKSLLGGGGLGRVYCAHDRVLDERVAVKVLHAEAARSPELSKRFRSEIKLARRVRHKNVCAIHEYGEHEGSRFVAMELVDGVDLHRVLRERGPLPPREAFDIAIQVAKGLSAIHGAGVIHRDLKTPNIMRDAQGDVRLLDFGIAKLMSPTGTMAVTAIQKVVGTPEYMSPEQIRGDDLDERSDLYGLGVVIYELFTGVVPFQGKSPVDTLVKHMNTPPPLYGEAAAQLPPTLVPILRRLLAKQPEDRHATARELLDALRVARQGTFPEAATTPSGLHPLEAAHAGPQKTAVLPRPGRPAPGPKPIAPAPIRPTPKPVAPPPAQAPAAPPRPATPPSRPAAPEPPKAAPGSPAPLLTPPSGPPQRPLSGAPPLPSARELAANAALDRSETYIELPQTVGSASALPDPAAPALPRKEPRPAMGFGLAALGLLVVLGAWAWRHRPAENDVTPPTTVADLAPATSPEPVPPSPPPAPSPEPPPIPAPPAPSPPPSTTAPSPIVEGIATPSPSPRPRRLRATPTPTPIPTPEPTPTPAPVPTTGTLDLSVKPAAEVEVDGEARGQAPLSGLELKVGSRMLTLRHPSYWPLTRRVAVEPGRAARLDVDLSWEAVPRARSRSAPYAEALDGSPKDEYFDRALDQLSHGDFQEAILTLEPVSRRLQQAGKDKERARAELYLGVALLELNRQGAAKERFERALELDRSLKLPAAGFSPKVSSFFATVRDAARAKP